MSDMSIRGGWGTRHSRDTLGVGLTPSICRGGTGLQSCGRECTQATAQGPTGHSCPPAGIVMWVVTLAGCVMQSRQ